MIVFKVNENDFNTEESHKWFLDFQAKRTGKSKFYKTAVIPKVEATKIGKEEEFNRLMQLVGAVGVDFLLECYDNTMEGKGAVVDAEQIQGNVVQALKGITFTKTEGVTCGEKGVIEEDNYMGRFDRIDSLKQQLDSYRPLPKESVESLQKAIAVDMTYNSNAIEGNTLRLIETKVVVEDGITIGGKTVREHLEALNHYEALEYVMSIVNDAEIGEDTIKNIHYLVMKGIDKEAAGSYRMSKVVLFGSEHVPPNYMQVPSEMEKLISWYDAAKMHLHPVELAAQFLFGFESIYPFRDGNGHTARLLMNLILIKYGYPETTIRVADRWRYYDALETASTNGETEKLTQLIIECIEASFERYFFITGIDFDNSE